VLRKKGEMSIDSLRNSGKAVITKSEAAQLLECDPRTLNKALGVGEGRIATIQIGRKQFILVIPLLRLLGIDFERGK
jgi:hypothetical protein